MLCLGDFVAGVQKIIDIPTVHLEKLFEIMDENQIGMVDFQKFVRILKIENVIQIPKKYDH